MEMDDDHTITTVEYHLSEPNKISCSFDKRYYDEIITRLRLQAIEKYQYGKSEQQSEKLQEEEKLYGQKSNKRILVVDDDPDTCIVYQIVLEDAGYECKSYTDPVKALKEFRPNYYDLILLDIKMPVLDGFELCKKIREADKTVQIIFITASEGYYEQLRTQSYPELDDDTNLKYVQKPIANDDLVRLVYTLIATNHTK
jgi:two-component system catabolic regulation response regulator CreB/two-component system response regulator ChvI